MAKGNGRHRALRTFDSALDLLARAFDVLSGVSLVVMTTIFAWLVFGRYVLNDTPTWVEQLSLLLMMVIAFFGAAVGVHRGTHLSVVVVRQNVPTRVRTAFVLLSDILLATFGAFMFWSGVELTLFKWSALIPLLQWPEGLRSLPLTICGALICLFSIGHMIRLAMGRDQRTDRVE